MVIIVIVIHRHFFLLVYAVIVWHQRDSSKIKHVDYVSHLKDSVLMGTVGYAIQS